MFRKNLFFNNNSLINSCLESAQEKTCLLRSQPSALSILKKKCTKHTRHYQGAYLSFFIIFSISTALSIYLFYLLKIHKSTNEDFYQKNIDETRNKLANTLFLDPYTNTSYCCESDLNSLDCSWVDDIHKSVDVYEWIDPACLSETLEYCAIASQKKTWTTRFDTMLAFDIIIPVGILVAIAILASYLYKRRVRNAPRISSLQPTELHLVKLAFQRIKVPFSENESNLLSEVVTRLAGAEIKYETRKIANYEARKAALGLKYYHSKDTKNLKEFLVYKKIDTFIWKKILHYADLNNASELNQPSQVTGLNAV